MADTTELPMEHKISCSQKSSLNVLKPKSHCEEQAKMQSTSGSNILQFPVVEAKGPNFVPLAPLPPAFVNIKPKPAEPQKPTASGSEAANKGNVTAVQKRLQHQLMQKHQLLQEAIMRQQKELLMISEQLKMSYLPSEHEELAQSQPAQQNPARSPMHLGMTTPAQDCSTVPSVHANVAANHSNSEMSKNLLIPTELLYEDKDVTPAKLPRLSSPPSESKAEN